VCVVDDTQQRLVLGRVGEQIEDCESHQEAIRDLTCTQAERRAEGVPLGFGQSIQVIEERSAELVQPSVRQLRVRLDAGCPRHTAAGRRLRYEILEERCLADPRLTPEHDNAAGAGTRTPEEVIERCALCAAAPQR
jgi:hypothetical protein